MTTNDTTDSNTCTTHKQQRRWYQSQELALSMCLIALFNMMVSSAIIAGKMESKPWSKIGKINSGGLKLS